MRTVRDLKAIRALAATVARYEGFKISSTHHCVVGIWAQAAGKTFDERDFAAAMGCTVADAEAIAFPSSYGRWPEACDEAGIGYSYNDDGYHKLTAKVAARALRRWAREADGTPFQWRASDLQGAR
jgi:hypothetical protein